MTDDQLYACRLGPVDRGPGAPSCDRTDPVSVCLRVAIARLATRSSRSPVPGRTDLGALIDTLNRPPRRRGLAAVISDFLAPPAQWARPLRKLAVRHDVLAIEIVDPRELELPDVGVLAVADPETGVVHEIQTSDRRLRDRYAARPRRRSAPRSPPPSAAPARPTCGCAPTPTGCSIS